MAGQFDVLEEEACCEELQLNACPRRRQEADFFRPMVYNLAQFEIVRRNALPTNAVHLVRSIVDGTL